VKRFGLTRIEHSMSEKTIIEVEGLTKHYGKITALDSVSFDVNEGEILDY